MTLIERHADIVQLLEHTGNVSVAELVHNHHVSAVTIRHDLNLLADRGLLIRTRGGAIKQTRLTKALSIKPSKKQNYTRHQALALAAANHIKDQESIILPSSDIIEEVATLLGNNSQLRVLTNGLNVVTELIAKDDFEVLVTGGTLCHQSKSFIEHNAVDNLDHYHFDKILLDIDGFDIAAGITTSSIQLANLYRKMCSISSEIIIVTDSSELKKCGCHIISPINKISTLITDSAIPENYKNSLTQAGIKVEVVT